MKSIGVLLFALGIASLAFADDNAAPVPTTVSANYPQLSCTTNDSAACTDILQMAADTRANLALLLKLDPAWRFPVHIHVVTEDDPLAATVRQETVSITPADGTLKIDASLPSTAPNAREFIQRQFVTAILWEKFFPKNQTFDEHTRTDIVPLWLREGLREWLDDDAEHNRASIVRRTVTLKRQPTLDEVTSWQELSDDRLLGLWQRAFCFYLVNSLIRTPTLREDFQQWIATVAGPNPSSAKYLLPTEVNWQRELVEATKRSRDIVYTWDETVAELSSLDNISAGKHVATLDSVTSLQLNPRLQAELQVKVLALTDLELRAHPSWRPIIALYRFGLTELAAGKPSAKIPAKAAQYLLEARKQRTAEMAYHQKIVDYINWFEVTKDYSEDTAFRSYFSTAQEMERVQADHPNPLRADVLQVESHL